MLGSGCRQKIASGTCLAIVFLLGWHLVTIMLPTMACAQPKQAVRIGVLAKRGYDQTMQKWSATAAYLDDRLPQSSFTIIPLTFEELRQAVASEQIDFVITNSAYYVHLEHEYGISRIATLKNRINDVAEKRFGGVIFSRADRRDISAFHDLVGSHFAAVNRDSLGGWQMAWREFHEHGIEPERDFATLTFTGTHDQVVEAVLAGTADAGTVRTDTLERMAAEGKIKLADIKVIHTPNLSPDFPYLCSTRLYPEWPIAKLRHTPEPLAEKVSIALLSMTPDAEAAGNAAIAGWTVPLDYQPVHELLQELHLGPYRHHLGAITLADFFAAHSYGVIMMAVLFILLVAGIAVSIRLNHKLHQTQRALSKQLCRVQGAEKNYREIFNSANEAIFVHDIDSGVILDVNAAMTELYGYNAEEAQNLTMGDISSGEYPYNDQEAKRIIDQTLAEGNKTFEWHAKRKDGSLFWAEINLKPAYIGGTRRLLAMAHDITERKKADDELQRYRHHLEEMVRERTADLIKSEASLAEAQRMAHLGSWDWQFDTDTLWWSDETYSIYGLDPEDFPIDYDTFLEAIHPDDRDRIKSRLDRALKGEGYEIEHRIVRPDGSVRIVQECGKTFFNSSGQPLRMMGTVQDITERKQIETEQLELRNQLSQAQKLEAIGTMAGGIAHDFNNILGAISGYTELAIIESQDNSKTVSLLEQVILAGKRARDLVAQILTFSRKEKLHRKPVVIAEIVEESLTLLRATIPTNIELQTRIKTADSRILADPTQIHQVILNLCTNAHHAMEEQQEGILTVELVDEELDAKQAGAKNLEPGSYVRLTISDTGVGMRPDALDRIFDPFFTTKDKGKGTGMGLSVVHGIVKSCEGSIFAQSKEGEGSTFTLFFPKLRAESAAPAKALDSGAVQKGNEHILFVDDEPPLVELGQLILQHLGYQVTAVTSSIEALEKIKQHGADYDLLITDQSMPKMTGCQLAKEVLAIRPDLPIILSSGYGSLMSMEEVKIIGIQHFLRKPYDTAHIAAMVREALDQDIT